MLIGNKVQILSSCHSTNAYLKEKIGVDIQNGEVICALSQEKGRGQRGNTWESEPNKNLTFSFYLEPDKLSVYEQFSINYFISLGVFYFLEQFLPKTNLLQLKWPNDIYYDKEKICGILIENHVKNGLVSNSVIGIGLNVNQKTFATEKATSILKLTEEEYSIQECLGFVLNSLNKSYKEFLEEKLALKQNYLSNLLGFHTVREYRDNIKNEDFLGRIIDVENSGALVIDSDEGKRIFGIKEVSFYV